ncbi:MAG TPA: serine protease [Bryobacteraceae bacterium]|nr:serine protease [Bryobacteraceae bacterium]
MNLTETYESVVPSIVAIISRISDSVKDISGNRPLIPNILGTGFLVSENGIVATNRHVVEALQSIPPHPKTGANGYGAIMFDTGVENGKPYMNWIMPEIASAGMVDSFSSDSRWYGEAKPDIAFIQVSVRGTPHLRLASRDFYIRPGTGIATAGFPMGEIPLTMMQKVNQVTPFIRRGVVSSVFPFSIPRPHGFTIDIMQQGGSSGSPIFYDDEPTVVGMMKAVMKQWWPIQLGPKTLLAQIPTNISIAVPAHIIGFALQSFVHSPYAVDPSGFPMLDEWKMNHPLSGDLGWSSIEP